MITQDYALGDSPVDSQATTQVAEREEANSIITHSCRLLATPCGSRSPSPSLCLLAGSRFDESKVS